MVELYQNMDWLSIITRNTREGSFVPATRKQQNDNTEIHSSHVILDYCSKFKKGDN